MGLTAETVDISRSRPRRACASETFLHLVESHPIRMRSLPALTEEYISAVDSKIEEIELPAESQGRYGPSRTLGLAPFFRGMFRTLVRPLTWEQLG